MFVRRSFGLLLSLALTGVVIVAQQPATSRPAGVLVSRQLATAEGLRVGDTIRLAMTPDGQGVRQFHIDGIYEPTPDPAHLGRIPREVRLHLPDLLSLTAESGGDASASVDGSAGRVGQVNLALTDPGTAVEVARDLASRLPGVLVEPTGGSAAAAAPFRVLQRFHFAIALVTIVASTAFLLALTIMLVDERRETIGLLRLIGLPVRRVLGQLAIEGLLMATTGAAIGLALAVLSESPINTFFQWRYDTALTFVRITPGVALECVAIAVPLGAGATILASWSLLRRDTLRLARR